MTPALKIWVMEPSKTALNQSYLAIVPCFGYTSTVEAWKTEKRRVTSYVAVARGNIPKLVHSLLFCSFSKFYPLFMLWMTLIYFSWYYFRFL
jgi:hypothetical protein